MRFCGYKVLRLWGLFTVMRLWGYGVLRLCGFAVMRFYRPNSRLVFVIALTATFSSARRRGIQCMQLAPFCALSLFSGFRVAARN